MSAEESDSSSVPEAKHSSQAAASAPTVVSTSSKSSKYAAALGRGKGLNHLGKGSGKRHQYHSLRDNITRITKSAIRRLARRGGIKRISGLLYQTVRESMREFMTANLQDALAYTEHSRRKTLMTKDIIHALQRRGHSMYGFGD